MFLEVQRLDSNALSVIFYLAPGLSNFYYRDVPVECNRPSLRRQSNLVETLLFELEPTKFPDPRDVEAPWYKAEAEGIEILAFALRKTQNSECPFIKHEVDQTVEDLIAALSQHYNHIGKPLQHLTRAEILAGYWSKNGKKIKCTLDTRETPHESDLSYAEEVIIENPLQMATDVLITINGRESKIVDMYTDFAAGGVEFPTQDSPWHITCAEKAVPESSPRKRKLPECSPTKKQPHTQLSQALRKKVNEMTGPASSGSNSF